MIKLQRVTKVYPDGTKAVEDVSLDVNDGELCVLLGPSGCGKTTTMKLINRLIPLTAGKILIDGVDISQLDEDELRTNIGYAIQDIGLFPHMTVGRNIETVPVLKGWDKARRKERVEELLNLVRMSPAEFVEKYPSELSGGQRQRVGVARALGADPPILLMDEPFGAIDPITRVGLQDEFLKIQHEIKKTIIFVTHDIYEAIKMADKIALMSGGHLVQYDSPANLLYRPKNEFVEDFVGADRALKALQLVRVKEVMWKSPPTAKVEEELRAAAERMEQEGLDELVVVTSDGKFLGRVGKAVVAQGSTVKEAMESSDVVATAEMVLNDALSLMLSSGVNTLAVVEESNRVEGLLTFDVIQKSLSQAVQRGEGG